VPGTASLISDVDKEVIIATKEAGVLLGRVFVGVLRSFDQFSNLILDNTVERIYWAETKEYGEKERGTIIIRGESISLVARSGGSDAAIEGLVKIPYSEAAARLVPVNKD
jgi:U6 snRNA-associated Sm-like protein LSm1